MNKDEDDNEDKDEVNYTSTLSEDDMRKNNRETTIAIILVLIMEIIFVIGLWFLVASLR